MYSTLLSCWCILVCLLANSLLLVCQPIPPALLMNRFTVSNAKLRGALCNDGSSAAYYYRNCTANWDRKPNDTTDYCQVPEVQWFIYFQSEGDNGWCYDAASCKQRALENPLLTSSKFLNATFFPDGLLSTFAEVNPNFYKAHSVFVPYCSSDLWVGNSSKESSFFFRGRRIIESVLADLTTEIPAPTLNGADTVTIIGGAGIIANAEQIIRPLIPKKVTKIRLVCDGCVLLNTPPFNNTQSNKACQEGDANRCPPATAISKGFNYWNGNITTKCPLRNTDRIWECLFTPTLFSFITQPVLVQEPQYDRVQLKMNGAWPIDSILKTKYAESFAVLIRTNLFKLPYAFSAACDFPVSNILDGDAFFHTYVPNIVNSNSKNFPPPNYSSMAMSIYSFVDRIDIFVNSIDNCTEYDCNASQCGKSQYEVSFV